MRSIYLDYNATTPTDQRVINAMIPTFNDMFGNPSSENHDTGRMARSLVDEARRAIGGIVGRKASDVIFTSGATEANNLVFYGYSINSKKPLRILVGSTEHKSVLEPCRFLSEHGASVKKIPVNGDGTLDLDFLNRELTRDGADIVSVMAANSETGVINPIKEIAQLTHKHDALIHCDATQAIGKIPFNAEELDVDILTFSSHKIYGPKGVGALVATRYARNQIRPILYGGGQENNMRSGTLNVSGIVGFGKACEIASDEGLADSTRQEKLRNYFEEHLIDRISDATINGKNCKRLPNTSSVRIKNALADAVIVNASEIEIATGSACSSAAMEPSHVLVAMGFDTDAANESIRISIGRQTTQQDIDVAINAIDKAVEYVRKTEAKIVGGVN